MKKIKIVVENIEDNVLLILNLNLKNLFNGLTIKVRIKEKYIIILTLF